MALVKPLPLTDNMNKTERAYAERLELLRQAGEIRRWVYEPLRFIMAFKTTYTPDFMVVYSDHIELHEVKGGFVRDDAIVKFKVAAKLFPEFRWKMVQWKNKEWKIIKEI